MGRDKRVIHGAAVAASLICLVVFIPALTCDFVNFDDQESILENAVIRALDGNLLRNAFSSSMFGFWMPLTWISYAVDFKFWGMNPFGYHLTNIVLHAANTGLVVLLADRVMNQGQGESEGIVDRGQEKYFYPAILLLAGLLWGIHPLRVESVVWVTERKDVLNGLFGLSSLLAYFCHVERKTSGGAAWRFYMLSLALYSCSLMAKPVTVVLPVMLLTLDWVPLGRFRKGTVMTLFIEKLPFLALSAALSLFTVSTAIDKDLLVAIDRLSIPERFLVSGNALFEYLRMFVAPSGILPLHPMPHPLPAAYFVTSAISLTVLCAVSVIRRYPAIPSAGALFLLPLLPVLGFLQNGQQAYAARYTYLPHIAISVAAVALLASLCRKGGGRARRGVLVAVMMIPGVLAALTWMQTAVWKNSGSLWTRVIEHQPVSTAFKSRGSYYLLSGQYQKAVPDFTAAMDTAVGQEKLEIYNLLAGRAVALGSMGRLDEALRDFNAAIELFPHPSYYYNRGITLQAMGRQMEAQRDLDKAGPDPGPIRWFIYGKGLGQ